MKYISTELFDTSFTNAPCIDYPDLSFNLNRERRSEVGGEITVVPNPAKDDISLRNATSKENKIRSYEIKSVDGKFVASGIIDSDFQTISIAKFLSGIYFISIIENKRKIHKLKFIKIN